MKIRFLPLLFAALLLSVATSEARSRRRPHYAPRRAEVARESRTAEEGGPLARSRGLSQGESTAVGSVLAQIANSRGAGADAAAASIPARRLSPDYYRVYAHRTTATGAKQRVAVKPPAAKPQAVAAVTPVRSAPPIAVVKRVAVAPAVIKPSSNVPPPVSPVNMQRPVRQPALVAPPATEIRTAFAPRKVAAKAPAALPPPAAAVPVRAVFRDQAVR